ncbi:MAG TPA: XdhC family protein [Rhizomicrobium sp.]|jgi:xanthine dehydrogenase accessory factor|nr:XdhC family protein [Rhizomicrobium sp.]
MRLATLRALNDAQREGRAIVRATDLDTGEERLINPLSSETALDKAATKAALADQSGSLELDGRHWFLSVYNPPLDLVIVGAGHIAQPLANMAQLANYGVRIIDPRTSFATPERFPNVRISHDWPDEAIAKSPLSLRSALVALTHDPKIDDPALLAALNSNCFYVGALGSRKSHHGRLQRLRAAGIDEYSLARIHGPIGLAIGARTPAEIALSILAEITLDLRSAENKP